jgi:hypothetical protein
LFHFPFASPSRHPSHGEPDLPSIRHGVLLFDRTTEAILRLPCHVLRCHIKTF